MATRRQFMAFAGAGALAAVGAVAGYSLLPEDEKPTGLPRIKFGNEKCARCSMLIGDERFASAWRDAKAKELHFDDIGCMVLHTGERNPGPGTQFWVSDYEQKTWLAVAGATFVISAAIKSPMSYGIAAVASQEAARALAESAKGQLAAWDELPTIMGKKG